MSDKSLTRNSWQQLRKYTDASIALGRCGVSMPTEESLIFQMKHAMARDAVHLPLNGLEMKEKLDQLPENPQAGKTLLLHSQAANRSEYLRRPDLGRRLNDDSRKAIRQMRNGLDMPWDLSLVVADGLSSKAMDTNALPFLEALFPLLETAGIQPAPLSVVLQSRVALADEISKLQKTPMTAILIGERPGLSSPDSMGIYMTWDPRPGISKDDQRNCISNIRPKGMQYQHAAEKLCWLLIQARQRKISGVQLKDEQKKDPPKVE